MKILLTGASGGIGKSILEKISSSENEVIAPSSTELDLSNQKMKLIISWEIKISMQLFTLLV